MFSRNYKNSRRFMPLTIPNFFNLSINLSHRLVVTIHILFFPSTYLKYLSFSNLFCTFLNLIFPPQSGFSPAPQPVQQSGGFEYYAQPQLYDPNIVYPAMAVPMYNDHIVRIPAGDMYAQQQPSHIEGPFSPKT